MMHHYDLSQVPTEHRQVAADVLLSLIEIIGDRAKQAPSHDALVAYGEIAAFCGHIVALLGGDVRGLPAPPVRFVN